MDIGQMHTWSGLSMDFYLSIIQSNHRINSNLLLILYIMLYNETSPKVNVIHTLFTQDRKLQSGRKVSLSLGRLASLTHNPMRKPDL